MVKFIFVRHGQSMANLNDVFAGASDIELSPKGRIQAEKTAEYVEKNFKIDKIYSSDLKRAYDTGKAVADRLGLNIIKEKGLREIFAGEWELKKFEDLETMYAEDYHIWRQDIGNAKCIGGESVKELADRIIKTIEKIASENDGKTVLIATHATPIRVLECLWRGLSLDEMKNIKWVSNASVTVAEYENGRAKFLKVSEDAHLSELKTLLPENV